MKRNLLVTLFVTLSHVSWCRDVRIKPVEHCDIDDTSDTGEWKLNGPQGKTITLKYILRRKEFKQFHLSYNNESILLATPTGDFNIQGQNATKERFEFPDKFTNDEKELWFAFKVKNLTKSTHQFTSVLTGEKNETDYVTIVVKGKNYVPSKEDTVSLTAGIIMVVLMLLLIVFFVVLYRNDNIIGGKYNAKMAQSTATTVTKKSSIQKEVPGEVNQGADADVDVPRNSGSASMNVASGEVEMHEVPLYSDEDEDERPGSGPGGTVNA